MSALDLETWIVVVLSAIVTLGVAYVLVAALADAELHARPRELSSLAASAERLARRRRSR